MVGILDTRRKAVITIWGYEDVLNTTCVCAYVHTHIHTHTTHTYTHSGYNSV